MCNDEYALFSGQPGSGGDLDMRAVFLKDQVTAQTVLQKYNENIRQCWICRNEKSINA